jgi:hypothetical protein
MSDEGSFFQVSEQSSDPVPVTRPSERRLRRIPQAAKEKEEESDEDPHSDAQDDDEEDQEEDSVTPRHEVGVFCVFIFLVCGPQCVASFTHNVLPLLVCFKNLWTSTERQSSPHPR